MKLENYSGEVENRSCDALENPPGHIANERKTLTTPSAWLPVAMALGFVVWAYIIGGVV
jgi:hypothetical protein